MFPVVPAPVFPQDPWYMTEGHLRQIETNQPGAAIFMIAQSSVHHHLGVLRAMEETERMQRHHYQSLIHTLEDRMENLEKILRRHRFF